MVVELTAAVENDDFWEDILNIVQADNCGNTSSSSCPEDDDVIILDGESNDQRSSALQHALDQTLSFFQDPLISEKPPRSQKEVRNKYVGQLHGSSSPGISVQSNRPVCLVSQHLGISQADSAADDARIVPNVNVTGNTIQPISTPSTFSTSYKMDCAVPEAEAGWYGVKRSLENEGKLQVKYPVREKTGDSSPIKRMPMIPVQSNNKLFGILSLILQAFDDPLTPKLEESYTCVLQRALLEIQNARYALQHNNLRGSKTERGINSV